MNINQTFCLHLARLCFAFRRKKSVKEKVKTIFAQSVGFSKRDSQRKVAETTQTLWGVGFFCEWGSMNDIEKV